MAGETDNTTTPSGRLSADGAMLVLVSVAMVAHYSMCRSLTTDLALDVDPVNLLFGMREFNLAHYAPHPPGYLVYVWMLRGVRAVTGIDSLATVQLLSRLLSTATVPIVAAAVYRLRPGDRIATGGAAALAAFHPFLIYHGVDGQTHTSEAFAGALLLLGLVHYTKKPSTVAAVLLGLALALGSAFRPSFILVGIPPIMWVTRRAWRDLLVAGATSAVGAALWVSATLRASGGYEQWRTAQRTLVDDIFVRTSSVFSDSAVERLVTFNLTSTAVWLALALAPALAALALVVGKRDVWDDALRTMAWLCLFMAGPAVVFYAVMFCSEPGYLLGFVPALIALAALCASPSLSVWRRRAVLAVAIGIEVVTVALPGGHRWMSKVPSIPELVTRDVIYQTSLGLIAERIGPETRTLYISDTPDLVLNRQLPIWRDTVHAMMVHSEYWSWFAHTSIVLATPDDSLPVPGPILLQDGPDTIRDVPFVYDVVMVDAFASEDLRLQLERNTPCNVRPRTSEPDYLALPVKRCFADRTIEIRGQGIRWASE